MLRYKKRFGGGNELDDLLSIAANCSEDYDEKAELEKYLEAQQSLLSREVEHRAAVLEYLTECNKHYDKLFAAEKERHLEQEPREERKRFNKEQNLNPLEHEDGVRVPERFEEQGGDSLSVTGHEEFDPVDGHKQQDGQEAEEDSGSDFSDSQEDEPISCPSSRRLRSSGQMVESIVDADDDEDMEKEDELQAKEMKKKPVRAKGKGKGESD